MNNLHKLAGYKVTSEAVEPPEEKSDNKLDYEKEASSVSDAIRNITDNLSDNPAIALLGVPYNREGEIGFQAKQVMKYV